MGRLEWEVGWLTNVTVTQLTRVPESLIIIGAEPEGLEFAQMFAHFGTAVTVLASESHRVLGREEPEIVGAVLSYLRNEGTQFLTDVTLAEVEERDGMKVVTTGHAAERSRR